MAQTILIATDAVIFTVQDNELKVLLIQMVKLPYQGLWAVPGGLIEQDETTEQAARRILETQTGVTDAHLEQLQTFDSVTRDQLGRVVSVAYVALVPSDSVSLKTTEKYADIRWMPVSNLPSLAYDHDEIVTIAVERLRAKIESSNIVWSLLPKEFALSQLQSVYEKILAKPLDKRNFRRKILDLNLVESTGRRSTGSAHRPAELFAFKQRKTASVKIL